MVSENALLISDNTVVRTQFQTYQSKFSGGCCKSSCHEKGSCSTNSTQTERDGSDGNNPARRTIPWSITAASKSDKGNKRKDSQEHPVEEVPLSFDGGYIMAMVLVSVSVLVRHFVSILALSRTNLFL